MGNHHRLYIHSMSDEHVSLIYSSIGQSPFRASDLLL